VLTTPRLERVIGLILILVIIASLSLVAARDAYWQVASICLLVATLLSATRIIDTRLDAREAVGFYVLILAALTTGSVIGAVVAHTLLNTLISLSIAIVSTIYFIIALKVRER
jgi:FtsH-binding integral membrane protein